MTTMNIALLSLLAIQWVVAYFVGRWAYRNNEPSAGFLWIPGIGFCLLVVFGLYLAVEYLCSNDFKVHFYGRHKPKTERVSDLQTMTDLYTCYSLISDASDFGTASRVWRDTYAFTPL